MAVLPAGSAWKNCCTVAFTDCSSKMKISTEKKISAIPTDASGREERKCIIKYFVVCNVIVLHFANPVETNPVVFFKLCECNYMITVKVL